MKTEDKIRQITEGGEYISWLDDFCKKNNVFNTYELDNYTEGEKYYISNLRYLYFGIEKVLKEKYYVENEFGGFYRIKFNGNGYLIGFDLVTEVIFYCRKVIIDNEKDFIDFYNIESNNENIKRIRTNKGVKQYG